MTTTTDRKIQPRTRRIAFGLALVAGLAIQSIAVSPGVALADGGRDHHRRAADVTFTKWIISLPADPSTQAGVLMAGVVGGDVGLGRYAGLIFSDDTTSRPGFWLGQVRYEFHGSKHSFVADLRITEDDRTLPTTATIRGVVTRGWLKGARVTGQYTVVDSCPIPTPGNVYPPSCIPGSLHLHRGDRD